jgi:hypothetical protein
MKSVTPHGITGLERVKRPINYVQGNKVDYKNHTKYVDMLFGKKIQIFKILQ